MKLFLTSIAVVLALICEAEADTELRKRPHQSDGGREGGGGGKLGGRLEAMIETQCSDPTTCEGVDPNDLDCTFQNEPSPPDTTGMDVDTRAQARQQYRADKKACKDNMVKCACCKGMSVEEILAARGDNGGSGRPFGGGGGGGRPGRPSMGGGGGGLFGGESGGGGRLQDMIETQCNDPTTCDGVDGTSLECTFEPLARPDMSTLDLDENALALAKEEFKAQMENRKENMVKCACCGSMSIEEVLAAARPLGGSGGRPGGMGGFRPQSGEGGMDIQAKLQEKCNEDGAKEKCTEMTSQAQAMDCTKFDSMMDNLDSMMDTNTRGGRRKNMFYCGCCRGSNVGGGGD